MKETKYAYASEDPHESPSFFAFGSHALPLRHASIMFGHDSPVAHLEIDQIAALAGITSGSFCGTAKKFNNNGV
jgi:hypothetical protein